MQPVATDGILCGEWHWVWAEQPWIRGHGMSAELGTADGRLKLDGSFLLEQGDCGPIRAMRVF